MAGALCALGFVPVKIVKEKIRRTGYSGDFGKVGTGTIHQGDGDRLQGDKLAITYTVNTDSGAAEKQGTQELLKGDVQCHRLSR